MTQNLAATENTVYVHTHVSDTRRTWMEADAIMAREEFILLEAESANDHKKGATFEIYNTSYRM